MKTQLDHVLKSCFCAALTVLCLSEAKAATTAYQAGNLLLGFRAAGGTGAGQSYVLNIGQAGLYRDAVGTFTLSVGNVGADLIAVFGADWHSRPDLFWGVAGANSSNVTIFGDPTKTLYASKEEQTFGVAETAWARDTVGNQTAPATMVNTVGTAYAGKTSTANSDVGLIQGAGDTNSWASYMPGGANSTVGAAFSYFPLPGIEGSFADGASQTALDLFRVTPTAGSGSGTYEGAFKITDTGIVSFNLGPIVPLGPEPARALLLMIGLSSLAFRRVRP